jgi:uncharacterized protein (TIGR02996 family)
VEDWPGSRIMQTEAEAFLQRIRAYPDDDAPRLVFADWLDEQGDPRGEFIRVQIALAQLDREKAAAGDRPLRPDREERRAMLLVRDQALRDRHEEEWTAPFRRFATRPLFRRGFVEVVNVDAHNFVRHAPELFTAGPLRHIYLLDIGGTLPGVLQLPLLSRLSALTIHASHAGEPLARAVAASECLGGLKRLDLSRNRFEGDAAGHLAASGGLAGLEELDLRENELGEGGARALAASPHYGSLRDLELRGNRLGPSGAEALAASERLPAIERLGLAENDIGAPRISSLSRVHELLRIPILDLTSNNLGPAGLLVLLSRPAGSTREIRIRELNLNENHHLGDDGARILARSPQLASLRALKLVNCGIGDEGARALAESPHLRELVSLDLGNNPIGDPGFGEYLSPSNLPNLRHLNHPALGLSSEMKRNLGMRFHRGRT